ncbi:filamin A-interacting protein 1-like [Heracleum sosnowskyi]|uniref:Filamin A-interacting protein 1-like n=1 Tax=Heracleum sosnowskyi TaxID=360622 RepID=A0AAD8IC16_9APIA|nr:filamin A-interacting protein 1-like [Heracleum sosnowskyi]
MMKKFFFGSSGSSKANSKSSSQLSNDNQVPENQRSTGTPTLKKSRTYSSGTIHESGIGQRKFSFFDNRSGSPSRSEASQNLSENRSTRCRTPTPERISRSTWLEDGTVQSSHGLEKREYVNNAVLSFESSESSSHCSSNASIKMVDRYIDGEQVQACNVLESHSSQKSQVVSGNGGGTRPPRVQYTKPVLADGVKQKPRSHSFREPKVSEQYFSTKDWVENGFEHESPRKLAKHVIERLSQSHVLPRVRSKSCVSDVPITIEDIYGEPLIESLNIDLDGSHHRKVTSFLEQNCLTENTENAEDIDVELISKYKKAEARARILSEESHEQKFLQGGGFTVPGLIQLINSLAEDRLKMAREVSSVLHDLVVERASATEELRLARTELDLTTRRLEKEKSDLQLTLEKELDRRSSEWSLKLEKFQVEEHRLRDRVRELAEQNVSLQREVSAFREKDIDSKGRITSSEQQLHDQTARMEELGDENQNLQQHIMEIQEKYKAAQEDHDCIHRNFMEKDKECKDLHKSITRMLRTCSEQEKTIIGLREGLREEIRKKTFLDNFDSQLGKLQMELMRLTGTEQTLRNEVESFRREADSLRHENISLLNRLKGSGKEDVPSVRLDQELLSRVCCLQNQGPKLLNECVQLCMTLLEHLKEKVGQSFDINQDLGTYKNGLDGQFLIESDMKLHGFKRGAENLIRSLQNASSLLQEKVRIVTAEPQSHSLTDRPGQTNDQNSKDDLRSELKADFA